MEPKTESGKKNKKVKTEKLRSIGKQSGESVESVLRNVFMTHPTHFQLRVVYLDIVDAYIVECSALNGSGVRHNHIVDCSLSKSSIERCSIHGSMYRPSLSDCTGSRHDHETAVLAGSLARGRHRHDMTAW